MVIVQAVMWPHGNQTQTYELLNVSLSNTSSPEDRLQRYMAHVLSRPSPMLGIDGYEADVEVQGHESRAGFVPLLASILNAAHETGAEGMILPPARRLSRVEVVSAHEFDEMLKRGAQ
jgi:hypothetical protein